ncbi:restriction endonuclease subunit S [Vreelandella alkaliphila]|uniref:restriction endonuclease subunit S n=1 Tax=Vreelandella alkaliphila TaxID=272774 RepID=UPI0039F57570
MSDQVAEMSATYLVEAGPDAVPEGYKQTEVGVIPEDWKEVSVAEILTEISMGPFGSDIKVSNFVPAGVPVLNGANVSTHKLKDNFSNFVTEEKAKALKKAVASRGDIVVTHRGTIGQISYIPNNSLFEKYVISQSQFRARFNSKTLPIWVVLYFLSPRGAQRLLEGKGHTGVPAIAQATTTFRKLKLPLPGIKEQTAIANALSDVDALISELEKLIAKKQAIKTATMQQLLTGRTRLPQFALREDGTPKGYKQSKLGEIPEDWETVPFRNLLSIRHGKNQKIVEEENGNYPIFATGGRIGWANSYLWDKPSVLIGRKGTINKPRYADKPFWTVDTLFYSEISPHADAKFIYFKFCMVDWMQYNEASGVPSLSTNTIESILTTAPVKEEQTAIANVLSDMDKEIQALEQRLGKTRQIKQGMMQELLTGKTRLIKPANSIVNQ